MLFILTVAALLVAFANGSNDNFKGVATLFGSGLTRFWPAMIFATVTTLAGSALALVLAETLLKSFSGKGLVPAELTSDVRYAAAVALAAGVTVLLATRLSMPVSTTHALIGGLLGAALAAETTIDWSRLGAKFALPLAVSPVIAFAVTGTLTLVARVWRRFSGGVEANSDFPSTTDDRLGMLDSDANAQDASENDARPQAAPVTNAIHWFSAGTVSFARGVNDTPKIAALLLLWPAVSPTGALLLVGLAIAVGGLIAARGVAETLGHRITTMTPRDGVLANIATTAIVISASRLGLPVSTTHVSGSALIGLGVMTGGGHWKTIGLIALAWGLTMPIGIVVGYLAYSGLTAS